MAASALPASRRPLILTWGILGLILGALVGPTVPVEPALLVGAAAAWGALAGAASRGGRFLQLARLDLLERDPALPPHRTRRHLPLGGALGTVAGAAIGAVGAGAAAVLPSGAVLVLVLTLASGAAAAASASIAQDRLRVAGPARQTSLARWVAFDTAVPATLLAGPFGALVLALRLRLERPMPAEALARHLAWTLVLYGLFLGVAAFAKTRRERQSGLVEAPFMTSPSPGALAVGGLLAVVMALAGPRVLPDLAWGPAVLLKLVFGAATAFGASCLGALKGARDPDQKDGPQR